MYTFPSLDDFKSQRAQLGSRIKTTPCDLWTSDTKEKHIGSETQIYLKREYLQHTGSFKARGALSIMDSLDEEALSNGVIAATGGNHGIAVSYAAKQKGVSAKIITHEGINPYRYNRMIEYGAEVIKIPELSKVFEVMNECANTENRYAIHAFDHPQITLGAGTCGLEFMEQTHGALDAVIVPIGGGGLASGISCAVKRYNPDCKVYGVEPVGANSMYQSLKKGSTLTMDPPCKSIADSLSAPMSENWSYSVCRKFIDEIVLIEDNDMRNAMKIWQDDEDILLEPACTATTAALIGPLKDKLKGQKVGLIMCGSNIDEQTYQDILGS